MEIFFKLYSKNNMSYTSDSIFRIIGRDEPALTKGFAYCLKYSEELLIGFLDLLQINTNGRVVVAAEQLSLNGKCRRDIAISIKDDKIKYLIIVEAKNPSINIRDEANLHTQILNYFSKENYNDVDLFNNHVAVSLTKERLFLKELDHSLELVSITWNDIIFLLSNCKKNDIILNEFYQHLTEESSVKTYDEEIFCPPCGDSYEKISELSIYCCPAKRNLKQCIYLMPRIPINGNEEYLSSLYPNIEFRDKKGKGCCTEMYRIIDSFNISTDSLELIDDIEIRNKVYIWSNHGSVIEDIKVYILDGKMKFERPKFTKGQNNAYQGYHKMNEIWSDIIKDNQET
jgi:hypothetical protein